MAGVRVAGRKLTRAACSVYGLLVLAAVGYCWCLLTAPDQWGRGDWDQFAFRFQTPRVAILRDGQLPLWNPYVNGGNVLLAHPHCPAFSPWYLPTLVLGAPLGLRFSVVLFVALGAVGMAALLRWWKVSPAGCFAGGVLLMMSAHFTMHATEGHLEWCALGLMPWVLLCLLRAEDDWRFVILGAIVFSSGLLYGSVYIVVVFVPVLCLWAVLQSVRTHSWRAAAGCAGMMGLTFLLSAVVLFPRLEFVHANPRITERPEKVAPTLLPRMLLDPRQASLWRSTRDLRNPPDAELARILPSGLPAFVGKYRARRWYRLDVFLSTTSDWTEIQFQGFPYVLFLEGPETPDKTLEDLNASPLSTEGLALQNPAASKEDPSPQRPAKELRASLYARLPEQGDPKIVVTRGDEGETGLVVRRDGKILLESNHWLNVPDDASNRLTLTVPATVIVRGKLPDEELPAEAWYQLEATVKTTSDWCNVQVVNAPYLFCLEQPDAEQRPDVPLSTRSLQISSNPPGKEKLARAILRFRSPTDDDLRIAVTQGAVGSTAVTLKTTPQGDLLETVCADVTQPGEDATHEYVLERSVICRRLEPLPTPLRWELDEAGMTYDWHEYGCYVTWIGLALVAIGLVVSFRRQWPLYAAAMAAGLTALGAALPIDLWTLWKQLPMYASLQVPSRFLVAVVFVTAICVGYGVDRLGRWGQRTGGAWLRRLLQCGAAAAIYVELAALGWNLFSDVFVCPPRPVPPYEDNGREDKGFAQRFAEDDLRYPAMYSAHYPYLLDNSGVLREYENIAVPRGKIRITTDPDYRGEAYVEGPRGEAYVEGPRGEAQIEDGDWSMSRVKVTLKNLNAPGRLVLNQNYLRGWKAVRRNADGSAEKLPAEPNHDRLVSLAVGPGNTQVEFYYLPDSFIWGAIVSVLALVGCLGLLLAGKRSWASWKASQVGPRMARAFAPVLQSKTVLYLASAVALNVPFLVCHPGWPLVAAPLVRSLAINFVLFMAPGLPLVGAMIGRRGLPRFGLLSCVAVSLAVFVAVLVATHLVRSPIESSVIWDTTWLVTNLAVVLNVLLGGPPGFGLRLQGKPVWIGLLLFAVAYPVFLHGATATVPCMEDHDYEAQGTGWGLLHRLEPLLLTDRGTVYYFAHPPLLHACVAGSFLYYDELDPLAVYDAALRRVRLARSGSPFKPVVERFYYEPGKGRLARKPGADQPGATRHRITGVEGTDYLIEPSLPEPKYKDRIPVRDMEVRMLYDYYQQYPRKLETRTPGVFFAALTVALLGWWITRMTGRAWLGLLVPAVYATSPEVFVRSCYGGYFAISNFVLVEALLALEHWAFNRSTTAWMNCLLAGTFAALVNHKLVLLPAAVVLWEMIQLGRVWTPRRAAGTLLHPLAVGFAAGTLLFWTYGLAVNAAAFWTDHVRTHLVDRVIHCNPLGYADYPGMAGLWMEFWRHTGYLLLPLGIVALLWGCFSKKDRRKLPGEGAGLGMPWLWTVWALLIAVCFTVVDWRQTKHLMPLLLILPLAAARWAALGRARLVAVSILLAVLLLWNLEVLRIMADNFAAFPIKPTPDW